MVVRRAAAAWAYCVLIVVAALAIPTLFDPYLDFGSPLAAQALNAVLPTAVLLFAWALTGRAWLACALEAGLLALLAFADTTKLLYLDTGLVYADFAVLGGMLRDPHLVLGFVHPRRLMLAMAGLACVAVVLAAWFTRRRRTKLGWRRGAAAAIAAGILAVVWWLPAPDVIPSLDWQVYTQGHGGHDVGVTGNIMLGRMTTRAVKRAPDTRAMQAFWNEPAVREAAAQLPAAGTGMRPDIVVVQSESLFDPATLRGFSAATLLPNIVGAGAPDAGSLEVPVFGGRTLQTEFEVLSGAPIAFYPGSMFAYYELVDHRIDALPRVLGGLGYETLALHPNDRRFWRRGVALPDLGFDSFQDIGSFILPRDLSGRGLVSDAALTRVVLGALDAARGPTFVFAISIENHGPWGQFAPRDDRELGLPPALHGEARTTLADYVAHAANADRAIGFLIDALKRRGRPTLLLVYGDHLPALPEAYAQLGFKDGRAATEHDPPYRVWANFPLPPAPAVLPAYLAQGWLLRAAGLPLRGAARANALAGMVFADAGVDAVARRRVLDEYADIAAANVAATAPPRGPKTVFVDRAQALDVLRRYEVAPAKDVGVRDDDLYLGAGRGRPAVAAFDLGNRVAALTLRPYVRSLASADCVRDGAAPPTARLTVTGDGRTLYRAEVTRDTVRLAPLDVRGVRKLELRADAATGSGSCAGVYVRVAQLACYSADCVQPGPALPASDQAPSRILSADPIAGDVAALGQLRSARQQRLAAQRTNLRWLLAHETASQAGLAPFSIEGDARLFMHPAEDHAATLDVDVTDLDRLVLTPRIKPLTDECKAMREPGKEAGVVGLTVLLDGHPILPRELIDRTFAQRVPLDVAAGRDLRIEVDKGNEVSWCDWFTVGVAALSGPSTATGATPAPATSAHAGAP